MNFYSVLKKFFRSIVNDIDTVVAQSHLDKERFVKLGYEKKIPVFYNLKFDIALNQKHVKNGIKLRKQLDVKTVWLALSTREGEEREIIACWKKRSYSERNELLILLPRHPERFETVLKQAQLTKCSVDTKTNFLRTENRSQKKSPSILIGDSIGEAQMYLAASDLILIGGSIKEQGGQNPLEACMQKKLIFFGFHMFNFREISSCLIQENGAVLIPAYEDWFSEGERILHNESACHKLRSSAFSFASKRGGSSEKYAELILNN